MSRGMLGWQSQLRVYRLVFGLLGLSAVVTEIATLVERNRFVASQFFAYFTVQSNLIGIAALLLVAFVGPEAAARRSIARFRGAATLYLAITGVVFSFLLAGIEGAEFTAVAWDNVVLHYLMPLAIVVDWVIDAPRVRIAFREGLIWLVYPIAYVVASVARGAADGWYPYPFLDPQLHGYSGVVKTSVGIALFASALTFVLVSFTGPTPRLGRLVNRPDDDAVVDPLSPDAEDPVRTPDPLA